MDAERIPGWFAWLLAAVTCLQGCRSGSQQQVATSAADQVRCAQARPAWCEARLGEHPGAGSLAELLEPPSLSLEGPFLHTFQQLCSMLVGRQVAAEESVAVCSVADGLEYEVESLELPGDDPAADDVLRPSHPVPFLVFFPDESRAEDGPSERAPEDLQDEGRLDGSSGYSAVEDRPRPGCAEDLDPGDPQDTPSSAVLVAWTTGGWTVAARLGRSYETRQGDPADESRWDAESWSMERGPALEPSATAVPPTVFMLKRWRVEAGTDVAECVGTASQVVHFCRLGPRADCFASLAAGYQERRGQSEWRDRIEMVRELERENAAVEGDEAPNEPLEPESLRRQFSLDTYLDWDTGLLTVTPKDWDTGIPVRSRLFLGENPIEALATLDPCRTDERAEAP